MREHSITQILANEGQRALPRTALDARSRISTAERTFPLCYPSTLCCSGIEGGKAAEAVTALVRGAHCAMGADVPESTFQRDQLSSGSRVGIKLSDVKASEFCLFVCIVS